MKNGILEQTVSSELKSSTCLQKDLLSNTNGDLAPSSAVSSLLGSSEEMPSGEITAHI